MSDDWQVVEDALRGFQMPIAKAALARLREREAQLSGQLADETGLTEQQRARAEAAEARVAELEQFWADKHVGHVRRISELEEALTITLEMLDGLAEQQAMPDDWWKPNAELARRALDHKEEK